MTEIYEARQLTTGYSWTECPRWHDGRLYFSDMYNHRVVTVTEDGEADVYLDLSDRKSLVDEEVVCVGTGFLPDGRLLVNSMWEQVVLVYDGSTTEVYADLRGLAASPINDMVVDAHGRAYISQLGYNLFVGESPAKAPLLVVEPDGTPRVAEEGGLFDGANGMGITADGRTLITAEIDGLRLTAVEIEDDGSFGARRTFFDGGLMIDGLCVDEKGAVWGASPISGVQRIPEGGPAVASVGLPTEQAGMSVSCTLGGADRRTLFITCGKEVFDRQKSRKEGQGSIWAARVHVPGGTTRP
ncbi:SMP-30/gluconolactonase/LRE family protein [Streptomyces sp. VNUA24]|uniref:SMP-30/gluconolactonase/LRE family protein n=1 Tax=Streptomyces sp. VNUA24 TaxID=3031131 RepID=UPI0023B7C250|nr:SMP-30/gluconolactonase/LRE family protein [Streptomyces sp. VNUA24]WEH13027.1 SMP-30/gluconolactonase/LRE family protein [Streptomyces sp. VNUA24]